MHRGDIISYTDIVREEGIALQRGMNFNIQGKDYGIILMSVRPNAPYADRVIDKGMGIIYEGHDMSKQYNKTQKDVKEIDQPRFTPNGKLTENGKFYQAAELFRKTGTLKTIKVYEKIANGIWSYNGFFNLVDAWTEEANGRDVFKFKLEAIEELEDSEGRNINLEKLIMEHNRLIPTEVKVAVFSRDKGRCVKCGSNKNLHYDHILPFSKGGSSTTPDNIQLLCAKCNLKKHDHIE